MGKKKRKDKQNDPEVAPEFENDQLGENETEQMEYYPRPEGRGPKAKKKK